MTGPDTTSSGWAAPDPIPAPQPFVPPTELPPPAPFGVPGQFTPPQQVAPPVHAGPPGWTPTYQVPGTPMPVQPAAPWRLTGSGVVQLVGALLAAAGAFLPWMSVSISAFGADYSSSVNGFDDGSYGNLVVLLGIALAVLAFAPRTVPGAIPVVIAAMLGLIGAYRLVAIRADTNLDLVQTFGLDIDVRFGLGLYAVIGGAVVALIGALPRLRRPRSA
jgi:hypothetical protein